MWTSAAVKYLAVLVGGLGLAALVTAAQSAQTQTITGTVVDLYCYTQDQGDSGMHHGRDLECAWACVKYTGQPVGILTSEGRVWELAGKVVGTNNENIAPYVSRRVRITGEVSLRNGMPTLRADRLTVVE